MSIPKAPPHSPPAASVGLLLPALALALALGAGCTEPSRPTDASMDAPLADAQGSDAPAADTPGGTGSGIGRPCESRPTLEPTQGDCEAGQVCLTERFTFPSGYCSQRCDRGACPSDAVCVPFGGGLAFCMARCDVTRDCRFNDGYECRTWLDSTSRVCAPTGGPVGLRDGEACFRARPGPNELPPLARMTFADPNVSASAGRDDSVSEAEGNVAVSPRTGAVVTPYNALAARDSFIGVSARASTGAVAARGALRDPMNGYNSDGVLAYSRDGRLFGAFLGFAREGAAQATNMRLLVGASMDDGQTWGAPVQVNPPGTCDGGCDKPWLVMARSRADAAAELLYAAYMVDTDATRSLVVQRSTDLARTWTPPVTFATRGDVSGSVVAPNLVTLAVAPTDGVLHATWVATAAGASQYGDERNRVVYRRSLTQGDTWVAASRVSRLTDQPVYMQPVVAVEGTTVHVAYASGAAGAWDIVLATSRDGVTWRHRKVNDEPETCATHAWPWIVADATRRVVHVVWLENRFGDGAVAYAACPSNPDAPCEPNEQVSDTPFTFTTSREPGRWHGDYIGLALTPAGELWASWSDTRTGSPAMYFSHGRLR